MIKSVEHKITVYTAFQEIIHDISSTIVLFSQHQLIMLILFFEWKTIKIYTGVLPGTKLNDVENVAINKLHFQTSIVPL